MIKYRDLEQPYTYYRLIGTYQLTSGEIKEYHLIDVLGGDSIQVSSEKYALMVNDDTIKIIGEPLFKYVGETTESDAYGVYEYITDKQITVINNMGFDVCIVMDLVEELTDSLIRTDMKQIGCQFHGELYPLENEYDEDRREDIIEMLRGDDDIDVRLDNSFIDSIADEYTVDFRDNFDVSAAIELMKKDGVYYGPAGHCVLADIDTDALVVPEGVILVDLKGSVRIEELVLPSSCRIVRVMSNRVKVGKLICVNVHKMFMHGADIKELHVGNALRLMVVYGSNIEKIVGDLRLYDLTGNTIDNLEKYLVTKE